MLERIANDNLARQISSSWLVDDSPTHAQWYEQFAAQGQSFFQASGDEGAYYPGIFQFEDSPWATLVGGTTLATAGPKGAYVSETVWNWFNSGSGQAASGGGISENYTIPWYQQGVSMAANGGSTTMRNIPDVALTADNLDLFADDGFSESGWGGTSFAAPLWAGFTALVNQQASANGEPSVGFINPAIYAIGLGSSYNLAFHDITTGNNNNGTASFSAASGYDLCTGWGTPNGQNMINKLSCISHHHHRRWQSRFGWNIFRRWRPGHSSRVKLPSGHLLSQPHRL